MLDYNINYTYFTHIKLLLLSALPKALFFFLPIKQSLDLIKLFFL